MSAPNVNAVRAVYEQWARGNFRAGVELYDPEATLVQRPEFPEAGTYTGTAEIADYMRTFLEAWDRVTIAAEELIEAGDRVIASVHQQGVGKGSGAEVDFRYFHVWTFRQGKVIRLEVVRNRDEALSEV
jgi:uncharacterized protein